jgi:transcriptional regulator with XRE-family HTH domain
MMMNEKKTLTVDELREGLSEELGARVRELRRRKGLRQTGLAELIGCSNEQISNIEKGKHAPGVWTIAAIALALDTTPDKLIGVDLIGRM